jgi:hypothetical protein
MCNVETFVITKQVMVKKVTDDKYETFFYHIGCGINYDYMEVILAQGVFDRYNLIERWSESNTC